MPRREASPIRAAAISVAAAPFLVASFLPAQTAGTWTDFRGPAVHGVQPDVTPPLEWSDDDNVLWKTDLPGPGASSPIVLGDRIYLTCYSGYGIDPEEPGDPADLRHHVLAVDRATGEIAWDVVIPTGRTEAARIVQIREHGFASPTLVSDGERLFAYFGKTGLIAVDLDGEIAWHESLGTFDSKDKQEERPADRTDLPILRWGAAATPVLHGDLVIVNASEESDSIRALRRDTGELVWKVESVKLEGSAVSPVLARSGDEAQLIVCPGGETWSLDPDTGEMLWTAETGTRGGLSPIPVCSKDLAVTFGGGRECFAFRLDAADGEERLAWKGLNTDIPSPGLHDGRILMVQTTGVAAAVKIADGEMEFRGRLPGRTGTIYAAPIVAGGRLYVVSRENGVYVYTADGKFELLAHNVLESDTSLFHGTPAFVGDRLYLRSDTRLYAIGES